MDFTNMQWGYKFVAPDLTTDDHQGGRYRYQLGQWNYAEGWNGRFSDAECPRFPGDGLCVARTLSGALSGGARVGTSTMLLVGWLPEHQLSNFPDKVRVSRLWVHPNPLDPVRVLATPKVNLRGAYLRRAYLRGANLQDANLRDANLQDANLRDADLRGADLRGAYLWDADLRGANLRGATLWGADLQEATLQGAVGLDRKDVHG